MLTGVLVAPGVVSLGAGVWTDSSRAAWTSAASEFSEVAEDSGVAGVSGASVVSDAWLVGVVTESWATGASVACASSAASAGVSDASDWDSMTPKLGLISSAWESNPKASTNSELGASRAMDCAAAMAAAIFS